MTIYELIHIMENIAPPALAMEFDNPGLLIGTTRRNIKKALFALDCTLPVAKEAVDIGADIVITHHPLFFNGVKHILPDDPQTAAAHMLIRHDIAMYAAHTNLDAAIGGVNDTLADIFSLLDVRPLPPENLGRIGSLPETITLHDLCGIVNEKLNTKVRCAPAAFNFDMSDIEVSKVALIGGSGGGDVLSAHIAGADVLITGEIKHSQAIEAATLGLNVIQAGHYETEAVVLPVLIGRLQELNLGVQYNLALSDRSTLCVI